VAALATLTASSARIARADCAPANHLSTCIVADTFWPRAGVGPFAFVAPADTAARAQIAAGLAATYLARSIVLAVPSADPGGAEFDAVGSLWNVTLLGSLGVASGIEADVALPFALHRSGVGVSPLADQRITALTGSSFGDLRLGAAFRLLRSASEPALAHRVAARIELAVPTGDPSAFSRERTVVVAPSLSGEIEAGRWFAGAELGVRLRGVSDLAGARVGPQVLVAFGVGAALLAQRALAIQLEAIALPTTVRQDRLAYVSSAGQREVIGSGPALVPAEWLVSLCARELFAPSWTASLGAGGALPLFGAADLTAPSFRLVLSTRYAFGGGDTR
jgi:hypothetical protein